MDEIAVDFLHFKPVCTRHHTETQVFVHLAVRQQIRAGCSFKATRLNLVAEVILFLFLSLDLVKKKIYKM